MEPEKPLSVFVLSEGQLTAIDEIFRPAREAAGHMTDEEINTAISEAVKEVRDERKANRLT